MLYCISRVYNATLICSLLFTLSICFGQGRSEAISDIRKKFQAINKDTVYKKVVLTAEDFLENSPDGGAELTGYFKSNEIKKIRQWIGLSHGNEIIEFYYFNNRLIFVYELFNSFVYVDGQNAFDHTRTERTFEGRYYFHNEKLLDYSTTGHNRFDDDSLNPESALLEESNRNFNLLQAAGNNKK